MTQSPRQKVIHSIQLRIRNGNYLLGMRLPSEANLAEELNVSRGTVRNALIELVDSRWLVLKPNKGYFVSDSSRISLCRKRHMIFILPEEAQKPGGNYLVGLEDVANANQIDLKVAIFRNDPDWREAIVEQLKSPEYVGTVLLPQQCPDFYNNNIELIRKFSFAGINHVVMDNPICLNGIIYGNFVGSDGYSASREIVDHLFEAGHRKIAVIRVFSGIYNSDTRYQGVEEQLRNHEISLPPEYRMEVEKDQLLRGQGRRRIRELMALPEPPTAVICSHDELAFNVIDELRNMNLQVPKDVSVVGFDDMEVASLINMTTVAQPFREIGRRAAEILLANCSGKQAAICQEFLRCRLVVRDSVANSVDVAEKRNVI